MMEGYLVLVVGEANVKKTLYFDEKPDLKQLEELVLTYEAKKAFVTQASCYEAIN